MTPTIPTTINLKNWTLVSTIGDQRHQFPNDLSLPAGTAVIVTSGPTAQTGAGFYKWTGQFIWRNSGDPGQLLDPTGTLRAESP